MLPRLIGLLTLSAMTFSGVTSCATATSGTDVACLAFKPLTFSRSDTAETVDAILEQKEKIE